MNKLNQIWFGYWARLPPKGLFMSQFQHPFKFGFHTYLQRPSWSRPDAQPGFFPWHMGAAGRALWVKSQRRCNCSSEGGTNTGSV